MTDKTKPISSSNPPESKGTHVQHDDDRENVNPPSEGSSVSKTTKKPAKKAVTETE